jgi:TolA-binding protein
MAKSSTGEPLGIVRSTAVISLGLVALAGSIAASLCRRIVPASTGSNTSTTGVSKLVLDEWEADLSRLNLPSRREVEAMQQQIAELEAQIDQLIQHASQSKEDE